MGFQTFYTFWMSPPSDFAVSTNSWWVESGDTYRLFENPCSKSSLSHTILNFNRTNSQSIPNHDSCWITDLLISPNKQRCYMLHLVLKCVWFRWIPPLVILKTAGIYTVLKAYTSQSFHLRSFKCSKVVDNNSAHRSSAQLAKTLYALVLSLTWLTVAPLNLHKYEDEAEEEKKASRPHFCLF